MLPFTRQQFFQVFADYNSSTWPAELIAYPLAIAALVLAWKGSRNGNRLVPASLALMWAWVAVVYHGLFFAEINPIARVFAFAFVAQSVLFVWQALGRGGPEFEPRSHVRMTAGAAMILYALVLYPLIGLAVGERYPALPLFGTSPCPLLIFTLGLMLWARTVPWWLWVIPMGWAVVGGSASILLSVTQDWALPVSALAVLLIKWLDRSGGSTTV